MTLLTDRKGAALLEFALAIPIFITFMVATAQIGLFLFARAGLKAAVSEGARYATIFPRPSNQQVIERIQAKRFGVDPSGLNGPTVTNCMVNTRPCIDIEVSYTTKLDFIFVATSPIVIVEKRRAFVQQ